MLLSHIENEFEKKLTLNSIRKKFFFVKSKSRRSVGRDVNWFTKVFEFRIRRRQKD